MSFKVLILAAGKGTRFKSEKPKVLHEILGKPMLFYILDASFKSGANDVAVVLGHKWEEIKSFIDRVFPEAKIFLQERQLGTGHAVMCAAEFFKDFDGKVVILNGDMPLIKADDIKKLAGCDADACVSSATVEDPYGYGRIITDQKGNFLKIVEEKDASEEQKKVKQVNTGLYSFKASSLPNYLRKLSNQNSQGEYYLTDVLRLIKEDGKDVKIVPIDFERTMGVNTRYELSAAERILQEQIIKRLSLSGVTIHNPSQAYIEADVEIGEDTQIFAPVYIRGKTSIGRSCVIMPYCDIRNSFIDDNVTVESYCWLEGAKLMSNSSVGPFAKLRPQTVLEEGARVGTFVETKKAQIGKNAKANHLSYLGDCKIGENTNVGAGTITCNYDGFRKWETLIGKDAFIGSDTILVAPVKVGDGAITAAGSVITKDVPENALAIGRAKQINLEGKAEKIRQKKRKS